MATPPGDGSSGGYVTEDMEVEAVGNVTEAMEVEAVGNEGTVGSPTEPSENGSLPDTVPPTEVNTVEPTAVAPSMVTVDFQEKQWYSQAGDVANLSELFGMVPEEYEEVVIESDEEKECLQQPLSRRN